jgi:hypothetical protein
MTFGGPHLGHIFSILDVIIEVILIIERLRNCHYLLKSMENVGMSVGYRFRPFHTHNPEVVGSNPAPATNVLSRTWKKF